MAHQNCSVKACVSERPQPRRPARPVTHRLCASCSARLGESLSRLPALYDTCGQFLTNGRRQGLERIRGVRSNGISLNEAAVSARAEILTVLASWAVLVVEQRRLQERPRRDADVLCAFLTTHRTWLSAHPAAPDLLAELTEVISTAEAVQEPGPGRTELGSCGQNECDAAVYVSFDDRSRPAAVACDAGHVWQPNQWLLLRRHLNRSAAGEQYTGEDIAV